MRYRLVDEITFKKAAEAADDVTASAILGPFFRQDHPIRENGSTITFDTPEDGQVALMHGKVTDGKTGKPLANASVDIWQASTNGKDTPMLVLVYRLTAPGLYEQQDPNQRDHNLRGKFITDAEGRYSCYCLRPTPYPVCDLVQS